jgi:hypothetical protein
MNHLSKQLATFCVSAIGVLGLLTLPGCGAAPASQEPGEAFHRETAEEAKLIPAGQPSELDPGVPGEAVEEEIASGLESSAQNCVYIQWCNEPNSSWGSVCRVRSSCVNQCNTNFEVLRQECIRDALYVCGAITEPSVTRGCP